MPINVVFPSSRSRIPFTPHCRFTIISSTPFEMDYTVAIVLGTLCVIIFTVGLASLVGIAIKKDPNTPSLPK